MSLPPDHVGSDDAARQRWPGILLLSIAVASICLAINERDGEFWPSALRYVSIGISACALAVIVPRARDRGLASLIVNLGGVGLAVVLGLAVFMSPPSGWFPWSNDLLVAERQ